MPQGRIAGGTDDRLDIVLRQVAVTRHQLHRLLVGRFRLLVIARPEIGQRQTAIGVLQIAFGKLRPGKHLLVERDRLGGPAGIGQLVGIFPQHLGAALWRALDHGCELLGGLVVPVLAGKVARGTNKRLY